MSQPIESLRPAPPDVSDDPLNSILLLLYELTIANAPLPPSDCRDIADKIAAHVSSARMSMPLDCAMCDAPKSFVISPLDPAVGHCFKEQQSWRVNVTADKGDNNGR